MVWTDQMYCFLVVLLSCLVLVKAADNDTAMPLPAIPMSAMPQEPKRSGALASLVKMFIDIPMGIVEAFKDGADAIENTVVAIMRGIF